MINVVYFSSASGYTHRFVTKLGAKAQRIPMFKKDDPLTVDKPFVLIVPTYGGERGERPVLPQVIRFLNDPHNRELLRGVISCGNRSFGETFCLAGNVISQKCNVPNLYQVELFGTPEDVMAVQDILGSMPKQP